MNNYNNEEYLKLSDACFGDFRISPKPENKTFKY